MGKSKRDADFLSDLYPFVYYWSITSAFPTYTTYVTVHERIVLEARLWSFLNNHGRLNTIQAKLCLTGFTGHLHIAWILIFLRTFGKQFNLGARNQKIKMWTLFYPKAQCPIPPPLFLVAPFFSTSSFMYFILLPVLSFSFRPTAWMTKRWILRHGKEVYFLICVKKEG